MLLKADGLYVFGPYRLDAHEQRLLRDGEPVPLPPKAFDLLLAVVARAGSLATKEELLAEVWPGTFVEEANLSYNVSLLRKALGEDERYIETIPKRGYRFIAPVSLVPREAAGSSSRNRRLRWIAAVATLAALGGSGWMAWRTGLSGERNRPEPITVPVTSFGGLAFMPDLSPDGTRVAYQWDGRHAESEPPNWDIYVQSLEGGDPFGLATSPASESFPVWSPDGERIAYIKSVGDGRYAIQIKPAMGGTEQMVVPPEFNPAPRKIDWSPYGNMLAFTVDRPGAGGIALFFLDTGQLRPLTSPTADSFDRVPSFSPDGRTVAFIRTTEATQAYGDLYTIGVGDGRERRITGGVFIFGEDWTADGKELVFSSNRTGPAALWRIAADGSEVNPRPVAGVGTNAYFPTVASKGNELAYHEDRQDQDIWRTPIPAGHDAAGPLLGPATLVQGSTRMDASPQVSRDGKHLVFASQRSGNQDIWVSDINGLNPLRIASLPGSPAGSPRWSPTGTRVAFDASIAGHYGIFVVGLQGGEPKSLTPDHFDNVVPSWSGDEKWIYFSSTRTGRDEVWKVPVEGGAARRVTRGGGFAPFESGDGFIYYLRDGMGRGIWRVPVEGEGGEETFVLDGPSPGFWGYWTLLPDRIYFATQESVGSAPALQAFGGALVWYYDFKSKEIVKVGRLDAPAIPIYPAFVVSPDQGSIYYVKAKPRTADIMLVKNFR